MLKVEDMDTGKVIGWITDRGAYVDWCSGEFGGTVPNRDDALARIEEVELKRRHNER